MIEFFISGNLRGDAVMNKIGDRSVINFHVCHSETWKNRDENKEAKKYWVDCAYISDSQELLSMLTKGVHVIAKGTPEAKVHVKQDGTPTPVQYLRVSKIEVTSKKRKEDIIV